MSSMVFDEIVPVTFLSNSISEGGTTGAGPGISSINVKARYRDINRTGALNRYTVAADIPSPPVILPPYARTIGRKLLVVSPGSL